MLQVSRRNRARPIRKIYEVDPLCCPNCLRKMRVAAGPKHRAEMRIFWISCFAWRMIAVPVLATFPYLCKRRHFSNDGKRTEIRKSPIGLLRLNLNQSTKGGRYAVDLVCGTCGFVDAGTYNRHHDGRRHSRSSGRRPRRGADPINSKSKTGVTMARVRGNNERCRADPVLGSRRCLLQFRGMRKVFARRIVVAGFA